MEPLGHGNMSFNRFENCVNRIKYKIGVINDPLGQTHSSSVVNIVFIRILFVLLDFEKCDGRTENMYEHNDHYRS